MRLLYLSRHLDEIEETRLVPAGLVAYQFSARGHDLAQILLGAALTHRRDAAAVYYRSRPLVLTAGLTAREALAATIGRIGSPNGGRDIGVVHHLPARSGPTILPVSGDVGAQYTPALGWAQAIRYRAGQLGEAEWDGAVALAVGGDGSAATPGFWAGLNAAAAAVLPLVMVIEDNGYAISVPSRVQTPGGNMAANLAAFTGVRVLEGDGTEPLEAARLIADALTHTRSGAGPALLRLAVPRLSGHSVTDNQAYKSPELLAAEEAADPLPKLRRLLVPDEIPESDWAQIEAETQAEVEAAAEWASEQPDGAAESATRFVFSDGAVAQAVGGLRPEAAGVPVPEVEERAPEPVRMNMVDAIRRVISTELAANPRLVVFGEDVGVKGGVHGATRDLQSAFGSERVFDTPLTEEGIIGRAVGMAMAGLMPVPEIQFRKYADPATEQLNDAGTVRWRTHNNFACPMVVRIPVGFGRSTGDPWHSVCGESVFAHAVGWRVAFPSNAEAAAGLLRSALRGDDPTYFLEHRALYDTAAGRRPYPGDEYCVPFGRAEMVQAGRDLTLVTWGAFVARSVEAAGAFGDAVEVIDLQTIVPWDKERVLESVARTGRLLVAHEDAWTAGFGAEIAATVAQEAFAYLDAPVSRVASADCPVPYNRTLMQGVVPDTGALKGAIEAVLAF